MKRFLILTMFCFVNTICAQNEMQASPNVRQTADEAALAKAQWIVAHPKEYEALNNRPATDYSVPTPEIAEVDGADAQFKQKAEAEWRAREQKHQTWLQQQAAKQEAARLAVVETADVALTADAPMFAIKSPAITPYMEGIFNRIKEAEFPGNMMQLSDSETQMQVRTAWIQTHADLYQLFVWAVQTTDGKIRLTQKEFDQLTIELQKEIKAFPYDYIITP